MLVLTSCLQAEIFSDLLVVTWMGEVKDAVTDEVHLENKQKNIVILIKFAPVTVMV